MDLARQSHESTHRYADIEVVIPVYNEESAVVSCVTALHQHLASFPCEASITIVDNGSSDATWRIARRLAVDLDRVDAIHADERGRGLALRTAWLRSTARVVAYMDADLSTDLAALLPLVAQLLSDAGDVAVGTRFEHRRM